VIGADSYRQSPNTGGSTQGKAKVAIIFHDEEYPESLHSAEDVQAFFAQSSTQASTNAAIDPDSIAGCVDYAQIPWHTGAGSPHNWACEGYEHDGYAHQSAAEWLDAHGIALLERSARFFAWRCHQLGIPPRKISASEYLAALAANDPSMGGIMGHDTITEAAQVRGGHTDPGPQFPWGYFIKRVRHHYYGNEEDSSMAELTSEVQAAFDKLAVGTLKAVVDSVEETADRVLALLDQRGKAEAVTAAAAIIGHIDAGDIAAARKVAIDLGNRLALPGDVTPT
jgi:hypothetical protein